MKGFWFVPAIVLFFGFSLFTVSAQAATHDFQPGFDYELGVGYIHTMGEVAKVWTEGGEVEFSAAYQAWPSWGIEASGLLGWTGMTPFMQNTVAVVNSYGGTGTQTGDGGLYQEILLGPKFSLPLPKDVLSVSELEFSLGGLYYGQMETGIGATDYTPRWTFGWGGFASAELRLYSEPKYYWGIRVRYLWANACVNDFYYDRYYGVYSYNQIPPTYRDDQRLILSLEIGFADH